jgi:fructoselysine 6-phosphate deglycase
MITGSGPAYPVAYSLGVCIMMEALWVKMFEGSAAEFFHGPFEIVNSSVPVILFKGEDPSRPVAERVERFCRQYTEKLLVYDSKDYPMIGVPEVVRPVFAPYILGAASVQLAEFLAELKDQPLTTRRYMGKVPY